MLVQYSDEELAGKSLKAAKKNTKAADRSTMAQFTLYLKQTIEGDMNFWTFATEKLDNIFSVTFGSVQDLTNWIRKGTQKST